MCIRFTEGQNVGDKLYRKVICVRQFNLRKVHNLLCVLMHCNGPGHAGKGTLIAIG